jgi:hypothetical protein
LQWQPQVVAIAMLHLAAAKDDIQLVRVRTQLHSYDTGLARQTAIACALVDTVCVQSAR